ncbi:hypothetical protein [Nostoc linckia]|uniref:hypothetical protein n=1 Tax=Nostoc linckia TaxID=92942 RepID=UPI00117D5FC7|nr:hypothetical protein [Nostoc linckia]
MCVDVCRLSAIGHPLAGLWRSLNAGRLLSLPGLGYWVSGFGHQVHKIFTLAGLWRSLSAGRLLSLPFCVSII